VKGVWCRQVAAAAAAAAVADLMFNDHTCLNIYKQYRL
jgi:hypothetical protein